jgi:hypothetical protein
MRALTLLALVPLLSACGAHHAAATTPAPSPIALVSTSGEQLAVQGSYCARSGTQGVCGDTAYPAPTSLSVVRPGETVRLRVGGATSVDLELYRFGCHRTVLRRAATHGGSWNVDLAPGVYEALVFARLRDGDTSGGVGLWVSRDRRLGIVRADTIRTLCP